jgi:DNA-binding response OmpR family regulator
MRAPAPSTDQAEAAYSGVEACDTPCQPPLAVTSLARCDTHLTLNGGLVDGHVSAVLVVDDDPAIVRMLAHRLTGSGYRVLTAGNGLEALRVVDLAPVDIAVCDISMPGMDGLTLLAELRRRYTATQLPVIMLTAHDRATDVINAVRAGANDYAIKPVRFDELEQRLEAHLAVKAAEGQVVRGFQLIRRVGSGATGVICEAIEQSSGRKVALKVLRRSYSTDPTLVARFLREAELAARVEHENVVRTYAAGVDGLTHYIVMELIRGRDLAAVQADKPIELSTALGITRHILLALQAMAVVGVTHRDIKPENVLITADGTVKVTDFGIAHDVWQPGRVTHTGFGVGTPAYASPQQLRGEADEATDVYGLGCTLYFMLTGHDAYDGALPFEALMKAKRRNPRHVTARATQLPPDVARLLEAMLAPLGAERPTVGQVMRAIDDLLGGRPLSLRRRGLLSRLRSVAWWR